MTAWLMRILPDLKRRDVNNDLRDPDRLHKRLMLLVPDDIGDQARSTAGVLFRVEETRQGTQLLIQSRMKPELERLPDGYGEISVREIDTLIGHLRTGLRVHYRIAANPSKRLGRTAGENAGKIKALRGADAEEWWVAKAASHGLAATTVHALSERDIRAKGSVRHAVVRFDGSGVVTNPDALREAVLAGIGRGKSYGCGLLSLAVAR
ncbi:type I-E CRISPR-associated protein Cas6/Cse3/CasE [Nonomuraea rubra]